jgi:hypothetical protein
MKTKVLLANWANIISSRIDLQAEDGVVRDSEVRFSLPCWNCQYLENVNEIGRLFPVVSVLFKSIYRLKGYNNVRIQ